MFNLHHHNLENGDGGSLRPFVIENLRLDETPNGYFRPGACVKLTSALRTSGLLAALPAEDLKTLILILTFVTPNGQCIPSIQQLAHSMRVSQAKARSRLHRLMGSVWQGGPLIREIKRETGMDAFAPVPGIVTELATPPASPPDRGPPLPPVATREAVIAYSRARYTRPRAEVEREIALRQGWELPDESQTEESHGVAVPAGPEDEARAYTENRLIRAGLGPDEASALLAEYDVARIDRQLDWLPYRRAKSPGRFLVAAVKGDYEEPLPHRARHA